MKTTWFIGIITIILLSIVIIALRRESMTELNSASHHTEKGFRNPWPGFQEKGFGDILKWFAERIKDKGKEKKTSYSFETVRCSHTCILD